MRGWLRVLALVLLVTMLLTGMVPMAMADVA